MPRSAEQTEELANAVTHGLGCVLALSAWPALAFDGAQAQPALLGAERGLAPLGNGVFVATMLLMFLASAAYHAAPAGPLRQRLRRVDHAVIFIFIAGSCTPFALAPAPAWHIGIEWPMAPGWTLGAVWLLALAGTALKLANRLRRPLLSTALYLLFGWLAGAAAWPALSQLNATALGLVIGGGLAYSLGSAFYLLGHRMRWAHLVWHVFVLIGCACHFMALMASAA